MPYDEIEKKWRSKRKIIYSGPFGTGKTELVKKIIEKNKTEKNDNYKKDIYLDLSEMDFFEENPIIPFIFEFVCSLREEFPKNLIQKISEFGISCLDFLINMGPVGNIKQNLKESIKNKESKIFEKYISIKKHIKKIQKLLEEICKEYDLTVVIDEFDRVNPDFSLKIFEIVKHFFSVKNITFILVLNEVVIYETIKKKYGEILSGENYLTKYVDEKILHDEYEPVFLSKDYQRNAVSFHHSFCNKALIEIQNSGKITAREMNQSPIKYDDVSKNILNLANNHYSFFPSSNDPNRKNKYVDFTCYFLIWMWFKIVVKTEIKFYFNSPSKYIKDLNNLKTQIKKINNYLTKDWKLDDSELNEYCEENNLGKVIKLIQHAFN